MTFQYDREGDIPYINKRSPYSPYAEQDSEEIGDGVIARLNKATGEIENLEVLFFSASERSRQCGGTQSRKQFDNIAAAACLKMPRSIMYLHCRYIEEDV